MDYGPKRTDQTNCLYILGDVTVLDRWIKEIVYIFHGHIVIWTRHSIKFIYQGIFHWEYSLCPIKIWLKGNRLVCLWKVILFKRVIEQAKFPLAWNRLVKDEWIGKDPFNLAFSPIPKGVSRPCAAY